MFKSVLGIYLLRIGTIYNRKLAKRRLNTSTSIRTGNASTSIRTSNAMPTSTITSLVRKKSRAAIRASRRLLRSTLTKYNLQV